jgi:hypothetical protein
MNVATENNFRWGGSWMLREREVLQRLMSSEVHVCHVSWSSGRRVSTEESSGEACAINLGPQKSLDLSPNWKKAIGKQDGDWQKALGLCSDLEEPDHGRPCFLLRIGDLFFLNCSMIFGSGDWWKDILITTVIVI